MPTYYQRDWDEPRGDEHDAWGTSTWYFEVDDAGYPTRQIEVYASGTILKYDAHHNDDEFGGLGDQPLDADEFRPYDISAAAFVSAWARGPSLNRP